MLANRKRSSRERKDPTRQGATRRRAERGTRRRLSQSQRQVKALVGDIPGRRKRQAAIINQDEIVYEYDYSAEQAAALAAGIAYILNRDLETSGNQAPPRWYFADYTENAYRAGALEENRDYNKLVGGAVAAGVVVDGLPPQTIPAENILFSRQYRSSVDLAVSDSYASIKGLSDETSKKVYRAINSGIQSGKSPADISRDITTRFDVAKSNADRIARTEVNTAYNNARMKVSKLMSEQTGLRSGVLHISALLATTRQHHAERHGLAFTPEQQEAWWNEGANRINCYCSVRPVLIDGNSQVVDSQMQSDLQAERFV